MIDVHCHFLPGIDDGARSSAEGLALARAAVADGTRYSVLTPHIHPGRYANTKTRIARRFARFRDVLERSGVELGLGMAAEVRLSPEILSLLEEEEIPFLGEVGGYKIMLLEFPHSHIPLGSEKLVEWLLKYKIRPLIAHPERNKDVMRSIAKIEPFIEMGCWLQLTASAVAGHFGEMAHMRAHELLKYDVFKVLASDAHNLKGRRPGLSEGLAAAASTIGIKEARNLVNKNPLTIVHAAAVAAA